MASAQTEPSMDEILASIRRIISEEDDGAPEVPVRKKLETLQLADEEAARDEAKGGEPAAQKRGAAKAEAQGEAKRPSLRKVADNPALKPAPEPEPDPEPIAEVEAQEDEAGLDDFDPLPEEPASGGATMEPAAEAHDHGEIHDDTFDETPEAVSEAAPAPKPAPVRQVAEAVASAVKPAIAAAAMDGLTLDAQSARQAASAFGALEENVRISSGSGRTIEDLVEAMLAPMLKEWLDQNLPRIVEDKVEEEVRRIARRR
jgi:cell pole-organizing protein PopZ